MNGEKNESETTHESDPTGSVSYWLNELNNSERSEAQRELWQRYFHRLIALARSRLPPDARREADEEDVALSALNSFFRRADKGEFPDVEDRASLWALLAQITVYKALRNIRRERRQKRGGTNLVRESEMEPLADGAIPALESMISNEPAPEIVAQMNEETNLLIAALPDEQLQSIARRKLEGYGNNEIAESLGVGLRTVERKVAIIRSSWIDQVG